jgi:hypothetical protein
MPPSAGAAPTRPHPRRRPASSPRTRTGSGSTISRRRRAGRDRRQGAAGLPPARSLHAARLPRGDPRARHRRRAEALCPDARELPITGSISARGRSPRCSRPGPRDLRGDPLVRREGQDLQCPFPQHQREEARLHGGFPDEGDVDMVRSLAAYRDVGYPYMLTDARPRPADRRPRPLGCRLRLLLRLHPSAARRARAAPVTAPDYFT